MIVVSDTSPLTALLTVGEVELLPKLFTDVVIPATVRNELLRTQPGSRVAAGGQHHSDSLWSNSFSNRRVAVRSSTLEGPLNELNDALKARRLSGLTAQA